MIHTLRPSAQALVGGRPMDLHVFFLPFLAPGHMIPMVDLARLFAARGAKASIITTAANATLIQPTIDLANADASLRHRIQLLPLRFPSSETGIPDGHENLTAFEYPSMTPAFAAALDMLEAPFKQLLRAHRPDAVVADVFFSWASELPVPRLAFHGTNAFCSIITIALRAFALHSESEQVFDVPGLPHRVQLTRSQLPDFITRPDESLERLNAGYHASYGVVLNSFYQIEPEYIDQLSQSTGLKQWHVGPVSLFPRRASEKEIRGSRASISSGDCLRWLGSKKPRSVLYVCFGSLGRHTAAQLHEIALALQDCKHSFLWAVKPGDVELSDWLPEGFEDRVISEGRGLIVHGWAPQLLILTHEAVGGFMTHCGWNSCMEAVSAGVPMATWPLFAEQFFNEKLVVDVHGVGVAVGATVCSNNVEDRALVGREKISKAVAELMGNGEEAEERRRRARRLGEVAREAVEEGGTSDLEMNRLIDDLLKLKSVRVDT